MLAGGLVGLPVVGTALLGVGVADGAAADPGPVVTASVATVTHKEHTRVRELASDDALVRAYLHAGYDYDDALVLSRTWGVGDVYRTKVKAGSFLARGVALADTPFADRTVPDDYSDQFLAETFRASGYSYDDAVVLAGHWGTNVEQAKIRAGSELKTVGVLPFVAARS